MAKHMAIGGVRGNFLSRYTNAGSGYKASNTFPPIGHMQYCTHSKSKTNNKDITIMSNKADCIQLGIQYLSIFKNSFKAACKTGSRCSVNDRVIKHKR